MASLRRRAGDSTFAHPATRSILNLGFGKSSTIKALRPKHLEKIQIFSCLSPNSPVSSVTSSVTAQQERLLNAVYPLPQA